MRAGVYRTKGERALGLHEFTDTRGHLFQIMALRGVQLLRGFHLDLGALALTSQTPDARHDATDDDEREMADGALRQPARSPFRRDQPLARMAADGVAIEVGQEVDLIMRLLPGRLRFTCQQPGAPAFDLDLFQLIRNLARLRSAAARGCMPNHCAKSRGVAGP